MRSILISLVVVSLLAYHQETHDGGDITPVTNQVFEKSIK